MKLVYKPTDGDPEEWELDPDDITIGEAKKLEKVTGLTMNEIGEQMDKGSFTVMMAFLWLFRRREEPNLALSAFDDIKLSELTMESDDEDEEDPGKALPDTTPAPALASLPAVADSA